MTSGSRGMTQYLQRGMAGGAVLLACLLCAPSAWALSEFQREEVPVPQEQEETHDDTIEREDLPAPSPAAPVTETEEPAPTMEVPLPDPIVPPRTMPAVEDTAGNDDVPVPPVLYDVAVLPEPVRRMRDRIMQASLTGEIEQLRPLIETGEDGTQLSFGETPGDPVEFLRELSGDDEGQEILAILYEVMSAGFVRYDEGKPTEMYVWPYFFAVPLETLDKRQRVELFKLVTAGDYEDMKNFGAYIFYRVGISPEGRWLFFVAGD